MQKLIIINSHPIQYFAPLYSYCVAQNIDLEVWYCSDESIRGAMDKEFGTEVKWDIPLLQGYKYRFFKNNSWKPSINNGFFGLMNWGLIPALFKAPKSIVWIHGWGYFSCFLTIVFGKLAGHKIAIRGESPLNQEIVKSKKSLQIKKLFVRFFLNPLTTYFLFIGSQNRAFYRFMGVSEKKLFFAPYCVDNVRFQLASQTSKPNAFLLREKFNIPADAIVILFSGKYIFKKRPLLLLEAFKNLNTPVAFLVLVGEGDLRSEMEKYIVANQLKNVILTGFINQTNIVDWYAIGDVFVMCSGDGETWGLSVNEAMNFGRPIIVSDRVGCTDDLVLYGENGYSFKSDDVTDLTAKLTEFLALDARTKAAFGAKSKEVVEKYSFETICETLTAISAS